MPVIQTMRLIILLSIVLLSALYSCRSSRQSATDYSNTGTLETNEVLGSHASVDILSLLSTLRESELSGIKVEFFPPDSVHPDSRAAPKVITIENAKAKESTEQATHEQATVDEQKTENLSAQSVTDIETDTQTDNDFLRPSDKVIFFSILSAMLIISLIFLIKTRK